LGFLECCISSALDCVVSDFDHNMGSRTVDLEQQDREIVGLCHGNYFQFSVFMSVVGRSHVVVGF
jgi:hypothetical protein